MADDVRSQATELVRRYGAEDAAGRAGCSRQMIESVAQGKRNAGPKTAAGIAAAFAAPHVPLTLAVATIAASGPVLPELRDTVRRVDAALAAETRGTARASLLRVRADTLHRIATLQGEGDLTAGQILKSRAWREQIAPVLEKVAEDYPDAGRAIAEGLGVFDA